MVSNHSMGSRESHSSKVILPVETYMMNPLPIPMHRNVVPSWTILTNALVIDGSHHTIRMIRLSSKMLTEDNSPYKLQPLKLLTST